MTDHSETDGCNTGLEAAVEQLQEDALIFRADGRVEVRLDYLRLVLEAIRTLTKRVKELEAERFVFAGDDAERIRSLIAENRALTKRAEEAEGERDETYLDNWDRLWRRPTAEAYAHACRARDKFYSQNLAAESRLQTQAAQLSEAREVLEEIATSRLMVGAEQEFRRIASSALSRLTEEAKNDPL